ncbi:MAG: SRPBCC family protein [Myxococcota bacterium]|nr:SRPBCC family protein [Myxococcota bacterium]
MARFVDAIDLPLDPQTAFDYLADFSNTADWDPGVAAAERLDAGPLGPGSQFAVTVEFLGRRIPFVYEIAEWEPPQRLVLRGEGGAVVSIDEIGVAPRGDGCRVTYEARVELKGIARVADPLLGLLFQRVGAVAARGLRERVCAEKTSALRSVRSAARPAHAAAGAAR